MYDENYKPDTPSAEELSAAYKAAYEVLEKKNCRTLLENSFLKMKIFELEAEKEELTTDNLNLMAAVAELSSKVEMLTEENKTLKAFLGDIPGFFDGDNLR